ncbi:MAG: GTPase Era [Methyloligellaceae bacterium]
MATAEHATGPVDEQGAPRCAVIALIGAPNAGKSTLLNQLVGTKVSIVTHKVQTTRSRLRGIAIEGNTQLVLTDTPGIFTPRRRLDRAMVDAAWAGASDADVTLFLIDAAKGLQEDDAHILERLAKHPGRWALVLNKVDLVDKKLLLRIVEETRERAEPDAVFMLSALTGDGVNALRDYLVAHAPEGPWLFPEDQISDAPLRFAAAEITREKLYLRLHQELPYASTVETTSWQERKDGSIRIEQTIFVERESQRKIVIGKGGQTIKAISMDARREISQMVDAPVHLFLFVKVRPRWGDDPERYREMGLDFPRE